MLILTVTLSPPGPRLSIVEGRRVELDPGPVARCPRGPHGAARGDTCAGGDLARGWELLRRHGTWPPGCGDTCAPAATCRVYTAQPAYRVGRRGTAARPRRRMEDIMWEVLSVTITAAISTQLSPCQVLTQGPVAAIIRVHTDLFHYGGGVYRLSGAGHHSVRTVANSWGTDWGEAGQLRIRYGLVWSLQDS